MKEIHTIKVQEKGDCTITVEFEVEANSIEEAKNIIKNYYENDEPIPENLGGFVDQNKFQFDYKSFKIIE